MNHSGPSMPPSSIVSPGAGRAARVRSERPRSGRPLMLVTLSILAALLVVPFLILRPREQPYVLRSWSAATVEGATIQEVVSAGGTVEPGRAARLTARAAGTVREVLVQEGQDVQEGAPLVRLDAPDLQQEVVTAERSLSRAETDLQAARLAARADEQGAQEKLTAAQMAMEALERDARLSRALVEAGAEPRAALSQLQFRLAAARTEAQAARQALVSARASGALRVNQAGAALAAARDDLQATQIRLDGATLRAPFAGQVTDLPAVPGQDVTPGAALVTLASLDGARVVAAVDEAGAARVAVGQAALVTVAGRDQPAHVTRVSPQAQTGENGPTVATELRFDRPVSGLRPNSSAAVEITVGERRDVPTLPRKEFLASGGEKLAYVVTAGGHAERREVVYGAADAGRIEVVSGLKPGERVITTAYDAFKDRATIQVSPGGELP